MLQVKELTKDYGQHRALSMVSFSLQKGKVLGVLGPNGSGKTTLFRILLGLIPKTSGDIQLSYVSANQLYGYIPEERALHREITVFQQLYFVSQLRNIEKSRRIEKINYWLNRLNLVNQKEQLVRSLSKGNQQKVQLICALIHNPPILILDEPLTGLDAHNVEVFKEIILQQALMGKMIILSSHQYEALETFCDDILLLQKGEMKLYGNIKTLQQQDGRVCVTIDEDEGFAFKHFEGLLHKRKSGKLSQYIFESREKAQLMIQECNCPTIRLDPIGLRELVGECL